MPTPLGLHLVSAKKILKVESGIIDVYVRAAQQILEVESDVSVQAGQ